MMNETRRVEKRGRRMFCQSRPGAGLTLKLRVLNLLALCATYEQRDVDESQGRLQRGWVTALQITGDAAYYTTGGWRVHNVVMHALS